MAGTELDERDASIVRRSWRSRALRIGVGSILLLGVAGCAHRGGDIAYNPSNFGKPDIAAVPVVTADRRLGTGDIVTIHVFKVDSLSGDQAIDSAGRINLPLVGHVQAAGRTTAELESALVEQLGTRYLADPKIAVTLKTAVTPTVTVDGSVQQPGLYPVQTNTSLIQTIAMAHGTADGANPKRVVVFRKINGQRMAAAFDLTTIRGGHDPDPPIYADDVVVVDGSATSQAFKSVLQSLPVVSLFRPF
ncbi:polysaccharide biosynthesis/export family protein [Sphingomonas faeni]|uniref:polysaccharide biosynthesis/export family protein n=1 Tax=Sphingomonas faeni TaxID=185950 RepID=UPI00334DEEBC